MSWEFVGRCRLFVEGGDSVLQFRYPPMLMLILMLSEVITMPIAMAMVKSTVKVTADPRPMRSKA